MQLYTITDIDNLRYSKNISVKDFCAAIGISKQQWYNYKHGRTRLSLSMANEMLQFLFAIDNEQ